MEGHAIYILFAGILQGTPSFFIPQSSLLDFCLIVPYSFLLAKSIVL